MLEQTTLDVDLDGSSYEVDLQLPQGILLEPASLTSPDGKVEFIIPRYAYVFVDEDMEYIIKVQKLAEPPAAWAVVGTAYEFMPSGMSFRPAATLRFAYQPSEVHEGIDEETLFVACYDEELEEWVGFDSVVDIENKIVTASVGHFSTFAVVAPIASPAPADIIIDNLDISPSPAGLGEEIQISITLANVGGSAIDYDVVLKINNATEAVEQVTMAPSTEETVRFVVTKDVAQSYRVDVNGLIGWFRVSESSSTDSSSSTSSSTTETAVNWSFVGTIIVIIIVVSAVVYLSISLLTGRRIG